MTEFCKQLGGSRQFMLMVSYCFQSQQRLVTLLSESIILILSPFLVMVLGPPGWSHLIYPPTQLMNNLNSACNVNSHFAPKQDTPTGSCLKPSFLLDYSDEKCVGFNSL